MMFCRFVLIFKFKTQSFNTPPSGFFVDKNLFLQTSDFLWNYQTLPYQVSIIKTTVSLITEEEVHMFAVKSSVFDLYQ